MSQGPGHAENRYSQLQGKRDIVLGRAKECAKYTLPFLFVDEDASEHGKITSPWNDIGTQGVNNLASKLLLTLFPPNTAFFRILVDDTVFEEEQRPEAKTQVEEALSRYERRISSDIESKGDRVTTFESLSHLLVGGNVLLHVGETGLRLFSLQNYVCRRDRMGNVLEIVVKESVSPKTLSQEMKKRVGEDMGNEESDEKNVDVYTHITREDDHWEIYQEIKGAVVPGSKGTDPLDAPSWLPIRMVRVSGNDYGVPFVELHRGDLSTLDSLTEAIAEGTAAVARFLMLVSPNGTTSPKTIAEAPNLAVVEGNIEDVHVLQMDKSADFNIAKSVADGIEQRLQGAFLMHASIQRHAERVTAEEIRTMAQELEDALGGIYSMLSLEMQLPYIKAKITQLEREGKLPPLPKDVTRPTIITGLEALGRGHERNRLVMYVQTLIQLLGDQGAHAVLDQHEIAQRLAAADGVESNGLLKTKQEIEQEQQAAQQQQMMQQGMSDLGPEALKQMGNIAQET